MKENEEGFQQLWDTLRTKKPYAFYGYDSRVVPGIWMKVEHFEWLTLQTMLLKIFELEGIKCHADNKIVFQFVNEVGVMHIGFYDSYVCIGKQANLKFPDGRSSWD